MLPVKTAAMSVPSDYSCIVSPVSCIIGDPPGGGVVKAITDPLGSFNDALRELAKGALNAFMTYIINPPGYGQQGTLFDILDGNILGVAETLVLVTVVIRVAMTLMARHHITNVVHAFLILVILTAGGATIFAVIDWIQGFGNQLCEVVWQQFSQSADQSSTTLAIPAVHNVVGSIYEIIVILNGGILLVETVAIYSMMIPFFKAMAPIGLALKQMGERGGKFFDTVVAGLLVMLIFGRALMVGVLGMASVIIANDPTRNSLSASVSLAGAFITALVLQFFAYRWCKKSVAPKISAKLRGTSESIGSKAGNLLGPAAVGAGTAALMSKSGGTSPSDRLAQAGGGTRRPGAMSSLVSSGKEAALRAGANKLASHAAIKRGTATTAMKKASASGASKLAATKAGAAAVGPVGWAVGGAALIGGKVLEHHHRRAVADRHRREAGGR